MTVYYNRPMQVEFLKSQMYGSENLLLVNLFVMLTSLPIAASARGRAAFHDKITTRMRFFSASNSLDNWSAMDMAQVSLKDSDKERAVMRGGRDRHVV